MIEYAVGKRYPGALPPQDSAVLLIMEDGGLMILMAYTELEPADIVSFRTPEIEYGIFVDEEQYPLAVMLFDYPAPINLVEIPFNLALEGEKKLNAFLAERKNFCTFILVELKNKVIRGIRAKGLESEFVDQLYFVGGKQVVATGNYDAALQNLYQRYPSTDLMWLQVKKYQFRQA